MNQPRAKERWDSISSGQPPRGRAAERALRSGARWRADRAPHAGSEEGGPVPAAAQFIGCYSLVSSYIPDGTILSFCSQRLSCCVQRALFRFTRATRWHILPLIHASLVKILFSFFGYMFLLASDEREDCVWYARCRNPGTLVKLFVHLWQGALWLLDHWLV